MSGMDRLTDEALVLIIDQLSRGNHRASLIEDAERAARELLAHRRASQAAPAPSDGTCSRCMGNGEIVTDWDAYLHPPKDATEEAVADCPDCDGTGHVVSAPAPSDRLREENARLRYVLAGLSSYLGAGLGDDTTTPEDYDKRIRWGIEDQCNTTVPERALTDKILAELLRARAKFPGKNVTFAALVEEVGELATATFEESAGRVEKEAVQVAVMAMRMVLDGDHCFDEWRTEKGLDPLDPALRAVLTPAPAQEGGE